MRSNARTSRSPARARSTARPATRIGGRGREAPTSAGPRALRTTTRLANVCWRWAKQGVPVARRRFGEGDYIRPNFIQPYRCTNVLIEGVTIINSPMWEIHPVLCRNVTVRGVTINTLGPNNDGCDPESCRDVLIERCVFNTGDDCIAIKSGRNGDGRRLNVAEREHHHPQLRHARRPRRRDDRQRDLRRRAGTCSRTTAAWTARASIARCGSRTTRCAAACSSTSTCATSRSASWPTRCCRSTSSTKRATRARFTPIARDIEIRNVTSRKSPYGLYLRGFPNAPIENVRVIDCHFNDVAKGNVTEHVRGLTFEGTTINGVRSAMKRRALRACSAAFAASRRVHDGSQAVVRARRRIGDAAERGDLRKVGLHSRPDVGRARSRRRKQRRSALCGLRQEKRRLARACRRQHRDLRRDRVQPRSDQRGSCAPRSRRSHARRALRDRPPTCSASSYARTRARRREASGTRRSIRSRCGSTASTWPSRSTPSMRCATTTRRR